MATSRWVYNRATGVFSRGGFYDPTYDPETEGIAEFPDADPAPDVRRDRYDSEHGKRPATDEELTTYDVADYEEASLQAVTSNPLLTTAVLELMKLILGHEPTQEEQQAMFNGMKARYPSIAGVVGGLQG